MNSQALTDKLLNHAVGVTAQRLRIAAVMLDAPRHLSADQVLAEVNRHGARVSKATVYNTLRTFTEHGLLREINVDANRTFYDSTTASHHHFYNPETGELMDIPAEQIKIANLPRPPEGTETAEVEVTVRLRNRPVV